MWVISGPFDGSETGEIGFQKAKLLKTGSKYVLGRKSRQLVVNHKKISHDHVEFTVDLYSPDDVSNPSSVPRLEVYNSRTKAFKLLRDSRTLIVNSLATQDLQNNDAVEIVSSPEVTLLVQWQRVCFYNPANAFSQIDLDACSQLGINVVHTLDSQVTHHLIESFTPSCSVAHSLLLATQFVRLEWLNEIIRLGNLPADDDTDSVSLETLWALPAITKYRPTLPFSLPPTLKDLKVWEPSEERLNMLTGYRFVFVSEMGRGIDPQVREMIVAGGGEYEGFTVNGGRPKLHQVLAKGMRRVSEMAGRGKGLVVVANEELIKTANGFEQWKDLLDELQSFQLRCVSVEDIVLAVITLDLSCFAPETNEERHHSPSSPSNDPIADRDGHSPPAGGSRQVDRLSRRPQPLRTPHPPPPITVSGSSNEIPKSPEPSDVPIRKGLTRRARPGKPVIIGIDDPSTVIDVERENSAFILSVNEAVKSPVLLDSHVSTTSRSSRLKRRAGTAAPTTGTQLPFSAKATLEGEPPLKKYRALFEASDPDRIASQALEKANTDGTGTQDASLPTSSSVNLPTFASLTENDSHAMPSSSEARTSKRKMDAIDDDDLDSQTRNIETVPGSATKSGGSEGITETSHRVASATDDPVISASRSDSAPSAKRVKLDATTSGPDRDEAFLRALASTKKGKKLEDSFDREFNKLKIAKPELIREEPHEEWLLLADFDNDRDLRGNFMVIVEMVVAKRHELGTSEDATARSHWQLRDNFKKFKKKTQTPSRPVIELVTREENDYGTGSAYWKENSCQSQDDTFASFGASQFHTQSHRGTRAYEQQHTDEIRGAPPELNRKHRGPSSRSSKPHSHNQANSGHIQTNSRSAQEQGEPQSLFLEYDGEDKSQEHTNGDPEISTLQSSDVASTRPRNSRKARVKSLATAIIVDDDSDDGATFKGFQRKRGRGV